MLASSFPLFLTYWKSTRICHLDFPPLHFHPHCYCSSSGAQLLSSGSLWHPLTDLPTSVQFFFYLLKTAQWQGNLEWSSSIRPASHFNLPTHMLPMSPPGLAAAPWQLAIPNICAFPRTVPTAGTLASAPRTPNTTHSEKSFLPSLFQLKGCLTGEMFCIPPLPSP